jgi:hypothetical protein
VPSSKGRDIKTFVPKMSIHKDLLGLHWSMSASMAMRRESNNLYEKIYKQTFNDASDHYYVLMHLE